MRLYSKEELSIIFGVNITTINAWINENRFIGISHENHDQINELTLWACAAPGLITVRDVQEMYQQNQDRLRGGSHDEDRRKRGNH